MFLFFGIFSNSRSSDTVHQRQDISCPRIQGGLGNLASLCETYDLFRRSPEGGTGHFQVHTSIECLSR